jgi:hypothetical protein
MSQAVTEPVKLKRIIVLTNKNEYVVTQEEANEIVRQIINNDVKLIAIGPPDNAEFINPKYIIEIRKQHLW